MLDNQSDDSDTDRRSIIKSGIAAGVGLGAVPRAVSAAEDNTLETVPGSELFELNEAGKLELVEDPEWTVDVAVVPDEEQAAEFDLGVEETLEVDLENGVERTNELVETTSLELVEREEAIVLEGDFSKLVEGRETDTNRPMGACNENGFSVDPINVPPRADIYIDDFWSGRVCAGTGIIAALAGAGVISGPGAVPAWVVAAAAGVSAALICANNEGCGVRIRVYSGAPPKVDPQDNPNISWI